MVSNLIHHALTLCQLWVCPLSERGCLIPALSSLVNTCLSDWIIAVFGVSPQDCPQCEWKLVGAQGQHCYEVTQACFSQTVKKEIPTAFHHNGNPI